MAFYCLMSKFCAIYQTKRAPGLDKPSYHCGVSESSLGELLRLEQLCLEASSKDTGVRLFQNTMEGFPKHKVCVLNTQHVLRGRMKQTVPISCRHTKRQTQFTLVLLVHSCVHATEISKIVHVNAGYQTDNWSLLARMQAQCLGISRPLAWLSHDLVSRLLADSHMSEIVQSKLDFY